MPHPGFKIGILSNMLRSNTKPAPVCAVSRTYASLNPPLTGLETRRTPVLPWTQHPCPPLDPLRLLSLLQYSYAADPASPETDEALRWLHAGDDD